MLQQETNLNLQMATLTFQAGQGKLCYTFLLSVHIYFPQEMQMVYLCPEAFAFSQRYYIQISSTPLSSSTIRRKTGNKMLMQSVNTILPKNKTKHFLVQPRTNTVTEEPSQILLFFTDRCRCFLPPLTPLPLVSFPVSPSQKL